MSRSSRRRTAARRDAKRAVNRPAAGIVQVTAGAARAAMDDHVFRLRAALAALDTPDLVAFSERLWQITRVGGLILIAGNGGSAANAAHMAVDLSKSSLGRPPRAGAPRVRALALSEAAGTLTAWANDDAYERAFAEQVTTLAGAGDAVLLLSVSGHSPNIVAAAEAARETGAAVFALLGGDGGAVRAIADHAIVVPSDDYQVVEDAHLAINHMMTTYIRLILGGRTPRVAAPITPAARKR
ncbi:MAG TPA: SIS domain-containing protein, partial [bacterium]|nr:SIS domain-containing protein [bacterium]